MKPFDYASEELMLSFIKEFTNQQYLETAEETNKSPVRRKPEPHRTFMMIGFGIDG